MIGTKKWLSKEELTTPKEGYVVWTNRWWFENDQGQILDYERAGYRYMQSNVSREVVEFMATRSNDLYKGLKPVFIEVAYYPAER